MHVIMSRSRFTATQCLALLLLVAACGAMAPPPSLEPQAGKWRQSYTGECAGRESETLLIAELDEMKMVFDDFRLLRDDAGQYSGSAIFIAPMPVDGRDIPYEITYALRATDDGAFIGTETIVEGGGHGLDCPIELVFIGER